MKYFTLLVFVLSLLIIPVTAFAQPPSIDALLTDSNGQGVYGKYTIEFNGNHDEVREFNAGFMTSPFLGIDCTDYSGFTSVLVFDYYTDEEVGEGVGCDSYYNEIQLELYDPAPNISDCDDQYDQYCDYWFTPYLENSSGNPVTGYYIVRIGTVNYPRYFASGYATLNIWLDDVPCSPSIQVLVQNFSFTTIGEGEITPTKCLIAQDNYEWPNALTVDLGLY